MQIGTAPASFKDILSKKEAVEAKLDELDQRYVKQKSKTKHTYVILLPYQQQISQSRCRLESVKKPTHVKLNKETTRKTLKLMTKCHVTIAFLHSQWKKMKRVFPGVSENVYRGSFPYNTRQLLWLGAIWTEFNWIEARIENSRDACMKIRLKKTKQKKYDTSFSNQAKSSQSATASLICWQKHKHTVYKNIRHTNMFYTTYFRGQWFLHVPFSCLESLWHFSQLCRGRVECRELEIGESLPPPKKNKKKTSGENIKHAALLLFF